MSVLDFFRRKPEIRADTPVIPADQMQLDDVLLRALFSEDKVTKAMALQIPTVQACISVIANTISQLPVRLYRREGDGEVETIENDPRVFMLN